MELAAMDCGVETLLPARRLSSIIRKVSLLFHIALALLCPKVSCSFHPVWILYILII